MISVDSINHRIQFDSKSLVLQPLTFDLFVKLFENQNEIISIDTLTDEVWDGVIVSPETLKQRIFLLRKALEEASIDPAIIQSVRGKGYRLILPVTSQKIGFAKLGLKGSMLVMVITVFLIFSLWKGWLMLNYQIPENNRVVFWTVSTIDQSNTGVEKLKQKWLNLLSSNNAIGLVSLKMKYEGDLRASARDSRSAIVSYWTVFESDEDISIRMQIVEPKTATILRSDVISLNNLKGFDRLLQSQLAAILRIVNSKLLPLTSDTYKGTNAHPWNTLRDLAKERPIINAH